MTKTRNFYTCTSANTTCCRDDDKVKLAGKTGNTNLKTSWMVLIYSIIPFFFFFVEVGQRSQSGISLYWSWRVGPLAWPGSWARFRRTTHTHTHTFPFTNSLCQNVEFVRWCCVKVGWSPAGLSDQLHCNLLFEIKILKKRKWKIGEFYLYLEG